MKVTTIKQLLVILGATFFLLGCENNTVLEPNDKKPNLIKIITYRSLDKTNLQGMATLDYDKWNNLIKESFYYSDTINPLIYSIFEYENNKKKTESVYNAAGEAGYTLSQVVTFFYEGEKLIKEETTSPFQEGVWHYTQYEYDERGNLVLESIVQVDPYFNWKTEYNYDANNLKTKTIRFDEHSNIINYTEHYYLGKLLSNEKNYTFQNVLFSEYDYKYNSEDKLIEQTATKKGETKLLRSISYSDSLISEQIIYDWSSNWGYHLMGIQVYIYQ